MWEAGASASGHELRRGDKLNIPIFYVACGEQHSLLVAENGFKMFSAGSNSHGELGNGSQTEQRDFALTAGLSQSTSSQPRGSTRSREELEKLEICVVAAGARHSAALTATGKLYTWGANDNFQLGHTDIYGFEARDLAGPKSSLSAPADVDGKQTQWRDPLVPCLVRWFHEQSIMVTSVACGAEYTLATDASNNLYSWGQGNFGNLGHGDTSARQVPTKVLALEGIVIACAAGSKHALAICFKRRTFKYQVGGRYSGSGGGGSLVDVHGEMETFGGNVYSWGHGGNGRLGHSTLSRHLQGNEDAQRGSLTPTKIRTLEMHSIVSIAAGEAHSAAISSDGSLFTWGSGSYGRLGHGGDIDVDEPTKVQLDHTADSFAVRSVALGVFHTMIISNEKGGTLYACGDHEYGKLGLGRLWSFVSSPVKVGGLLKGAQVYEVACGAFHTLAWVRQPDTKNDVFGWGAIRSGGQHEYYPVPLGDFGLGMKLTLNLEDDHVNLSSAEAVAQSLSADPKVLQSQRRQCLESDSLERVRVVDVSVGSQHSLVVSDIGLVYSFGSDEFGQLGQGAFLDDATRATNVLDPSIASAQVGVWARLLDDKHSAVNEMRAKIGRKANPGRLESHNDIAGDGGSIIASTTMVGTPKLPTIVRGPLVHEFVCQVACGGEFSLALTTTNQVYSWGRGQEHQLGLGYATQCQSEPQLIAALAALEVTKIAAGDEHAAAIVANGHLFTWGSNESGKLGLGEEHSAPSALLGSLPKRVRGELGDQFVQSVSLGMSHSACITGSDPSGSDNMLFTWGGGWRGRLGHGTLENAFEPRRIGGTLRGCAVDQVSCGAYHTLAVANGDLYGWGQDTGCLGRGHASSDPDAFVLLPLRNEALRSLGLRITRAVACVAHSIVVADDGSVWSCGSTEYGRLGHDPNDTLDVMDGIAYSFKRVCRFRAGTYSSSVHQLMLDRLQQTDADSSRSKHVVRNAFSTVDQTLSEANVIEPLRAPPHGARRKAASTGDNARNLPTDPSPAPTISLPIIAGHLNHNAVLYPDGRLFFWGCNGSLRCGVNLSLLEDPGMDNEAETKSASDANPVAIPELPESKSAAVDMVKFPGIATIPLAYLNEHLCDTTRDTAAASENQSEESDLKNASSTATNFGADHDDGWSSDDSVDGGVDLDDIDDPLPNGEHDAASSSKPSSTTLVSSQRDWRGTAAGRSLLQLLVQVQSQDHDIENALLSSLYEVEERERACLDAIHLTHATKHKIMALDTRLKILTRVSLQQALNKHFSPPVEPKLKINDVGTPSNREKMERIFSLLRGHPCFVVRIFRHHFCTQTAVAGSGAADLKTGEGSSAAFPLNGSMHSTADRNMSDNVGPTTGVVAMSSRSGVVDHRNPAGGRPVNNALDFVNLVCAIYADFGSPRNEHLFLACLTGMIKELLSVADPSSLEDFHRILFHDHPVLTHSINRYFTSPRVVSESMRTELSKYLVKFLNAVNDADQSPLSLEPNPLVVFEDLRHEEYSNDEVCCCHSICGSCWVCMP